ncbi:hypothetical protein JJB09_00320 [Rhizobium sp. KVB221]|uniref:Uncharacterized protein n=1 Tax=Rhizobium setariae TaxID=2801340 RepID=A0A937CIU8_9HYPH|nr:DUF6665 family protein [Rhizobium setariae]MBL0370460.1 hypothetical protein [Rhizobium setariae]
MSLRPPQTYFDNTSGKAPLNVLDYEMMAERADSLGRAGLRAEAALASFACASDDERGRLIDEAAAKVYALFIQREICGLKNGRDVVARYAIPGAVMARLGASARQPGNASA